MATFDAVPAIITDLMAGHAKYTPNKLALIFEEKRISWEELNTRINKVANTLIKNGLKKGDKVAVFMSNMVESIEIMFGIIKAGGVLVPLSTMLEANTLLNMIHSADSQMLFISSDYEFLINEMKDKLRLSDHNIITVGLGSEKCMKFETFIANASSEEPNVTLEFNDDCIILYSSGTTGVPKGILHTHYSRFIFSIRLAISKGIDQRTKMLLTTPFYTNSTWAPMLPTLVTGGTIISMKKFDAAQFLKLSEKEKPTHSLMVPTQYYMVLNEKDFDSYDVSSYKRLISVASPLHKQMKLKIIEKFNCEFTELYGLTEGIGTILLPEDVLKKPDSVGIPTFGTDIRIIDEEGKELPKGEAGEIVGYGSVMMKGYYKLPDKTKEVMWIKDGKIFLKTGDMGKFDEDGFLYILGRKKDMIVSGGLNIYSADIENVLASHRDVSECAVIGIPHEKWGETPLAFATVKDESRVSHQELKNWLNERLNKYQRVQDVEIISDFPRNALGKILKRELRERYS
ncbi:AMP-binding protein [Pueribacillus theae]|uniref:AMP-binding protein n=1 Tax=Pueribacillus theae TaxID=2171751 RepID=UPI001401CE7C|nr:AMP-binding protein [Pueribacillus theae]